VSAFQNVCAVIIIDLIDPAGKSALLHCLSNLDIVAYCVLEDFS